LDAVDVVQDGRFHDVVYRSQVYLHSLAHR
jgi:hypothetical protein